MLKTGFGLVEAAGVEPASEAASLRISTSVSRILVLAWRLLPTGSASASLGECPASRPRRPRCSNPVCFNAVPQSAGLTGGSTRDLSPGTHVSTAYAARAKVLVLLAFVNACAVTLAALGSQSRSSTAPSRPDAPTKLNLFAAQILPRTRHSYTECHR